MEREIPRIAAVKVMVPTSLFVEWRGKKKTDLVNLAGWVATGGDVLAPLNDPAIFRLARIASYGAAVAWDEDDLSIDAMHLKMIADEQRDFTNADLRAWQERMGISNAEAAALVRVSLSTWNSYRSSAKIPVPIAMLLRVADRDPLVMQAHLRPRVAGRPKKAVNE